jgi:hypothetical protein
MSDPNIIDLRDISKIWMVKGLDIAYVSQNLVELYEQRGYKVTTTMIKEIE